MRKIFLLLLLFTIGYKSYSQVPTIQTPQNSYIVSDLAHLKSYYGYANRLFVYSDRTNYTLCTVCLIDSPYVIQGVGNRKWALEISPSRVRDGLISIGGIQKIDSTITIQHDILWSINGTLYKRIIDTNFIINSADSGYYRRDLIYADTTLHKIEGIPDTLIGVKPVLPPNSVEITTIDVYGEQIIPSTPNIITSIPNLYQVTNEGNTTTNPIIINNNSSQASVQINGNFNRSYYWYEKNASNGHWANTGVMLKNDVADNPNDEHSGHFLQLLMGSTNSDFMKDGGMIRVKGTGGLRLTSDSGRIIFGNGAPFQTYPWVEFGAFETDGSFKINKYKNNSTKDSVLTTDENGKLILKLFSGNVTKEQLDSTAKAIRDSFPTGLTPVIQIVTSNTIITVNNTTNWLIINPDSTLLSASITFPDTPVNGQILDISFGGTITSPGAVIARAVVLATSASQGIVGETNIGTVTTDDKLSYRYNSLNSKWYKN